MSTRSHDFLLFVLALLVTGSPGGRDAVLAASPDQAGQNRTPSVRIPVILDTDIGDDIDDTWALVLLLKSPELDLKLVVGDQGKPLYRARLIAKLLQVAGLGCRGRYRYRCESARGRWSSTVVGRRL